MKFIGFMSSKVGRAIRVVAGLSLIVGGFSLGGVGFVLVAIGLAAFTTGTLNYCPVSLVTRGKSC